MFLFSLLLSKKTSSGKRGNVTAECKPEDQMFDDEPGVPCAQEHITQESTIALFLAICASAAFTLLSQVPTVIINIYWILLCALQSQFESNYLVGPTLGKEG